MSSIEEIMRMDKQQLAAPVNTVKVNFKTKYGACIVILTEKSNT